MSYYYVSSVHGTATSGDNNYETLQTGNITGLTNTTVYTTVAICCANAVLADGDTILIADNHAATPSGAHQQWGGLADAKLTFVSVDNTAIDSYLAGAQETISATYDFQFTGDDSHQVYWGITWHQGGDDVVMQNVGIHFEAHECVIDITSTAGGSTFTGNLSNTIELIDTEFNFGSSSQRMTMADTNLLFDGVTSTGVAVSALFLGQSATGGGIFTIRNSRLDQLMETNAELYVGLASSREWQETLLENCVLPAGFTWAQTITTHSPVYKHRMIGCSTADDYFNDYTVSNRGHYLEDVAQYLVDGAEYDGATGISLAFTTPVVTLCDAASPLREKIATIPAQNLSSGKTITVQCVSSTAALTDSDVWIDLEFQDGTNQSLGVKATSRNANFLKAGTSLTAGTGTWNVTSNTEYEIAVSTGAQTGATNSSIDVYAVVAKPSITVNFDMLPVVT